MGVQERQQILEPLLNDMIRPQVVVLLIARLHQAEAVQNDCDVFLAVGMEIVQRFRDFPVAHGGEVQRPHTTGENRIWQRLVR